VLARSGVMHVSACVFGPVPRDRDPVQGGAGVGADVGDLAPPRLGAGSRATDDCAAFRVGDRLDDLVGGDAGGVVEAA
jgi:hypothetical protein